MYVLCVAGEEEEEKNLYGNLNAPIQSQRPRRATERRLDDDGPRDSLVTFFSFLVLGPDGLTGPFLSPFL